MNIFKSIKNKKTPMRRRLFLYMLTLAVTVLSLLASGLLFFGHFSTAKETAANNLTFQMKTFERQVSDYFEDMERMGLSLSASITKATDEFLLEKSVDFSDITNNATLIKELNDGIFDKLGQELIKTSCSGAFVIFNATVNTKIEDSYKSKTGLYLQRSSIDKTDESFTLYRGNTELGQKRDALPHRQWRLEFNTDEIPDYDKYLERAKTPVIRSPFLTSISTLKGTSERTMNFVIPMISDSNVVYGFCGFEISELYFKSHFAQPSQLDHLTCMLLPHSNDVINSADCFSAGIFEGYYLPPYGKFTFKSMGNGIISLTSLNGDSSYVAKTRSIKIFYDDYMLTVAFPKKEYDKTVASNVISVILLLLLLVGAAVIVSIFFSKRFLSPLLKGIEQIQKQEHKSAKSAFTEINDLLAFLAEQDRLRDEEADKLRNICDEQGNLLEQNQADIERLKYSRKTEISPDDYEMFKIGLKTLTKTEKFIFQLYLDGKSSDEILEICHIQKGTLKYHNHNILGKLGVPSRKQMLRYATLLKQESQPRN